MSQIENILNKYSQEESNKLAILHDVQNQFGYISKDHIEKIASWLNISNAKVFAAITYYDSFTTTEVGKFIIKICDGTVCHSQNSQAIISKFEEQLGVKVGQTTANGKISLKTVNCLGVCGKAPSLSVNENVYDTISEDDVKQIISGPENMRESQTDILDTKYKKVLLKSYDNIDEYIAGGGFKGLKRAIEMPKSRTIVDEVKNSGLKGGLRGRSGSAFPVGAKWEAAYNAPGREHNKKDKYVIANGDEGDPGAFMDKWLMENNPYAILEGLIIASFAIRATKGFVYVRDEYPNAIKRMTVAIDELKSKGYIGKSILGSRFDLQCEVVHAAGSYLCGEESALMESIEGKPGLPRSKPPFPTTMGLFKQPTLINNVETLANVPLIFKDGAEVYGKTGSGGNSGTKVFSLAGKVKYKGLVELPMGSITLRQLVYDIGGGVENDEELKCIQTGGPSGGFIGVDDLDTPLDFDSMKKNGTMLGSGGIVVFDNSQSIIELIDYLLSFLADESCGTCTPCREGLRSMIEIINKIKEDRADNEDIKTLEDLAFASNAFSRCLLGSSISNPILTGLKLFPDEFITKKGA